MVIERTAVLLLGLIFVVPAYAYLDPGTGSMVLQGLLAGIAAAIFTGRLWWHRLLVLLRLRQPAQPDPNTDEEKQESEGERPQ